MIPTFLRDALRRAPDTPAIADRIKATTYAELDRAFDEWAMRFRKHGVGVGDVVSVEGDYGPDLVAAILAGIDQRAIVVPLSSDSGAHLAGFVATAGVQHRAVADTQSVTSTGTNLEHPHYDEIRRRGVAGLVLFSSGSTGRHKAAVHDFDRLLEKFSVPRHCYRTLIFLQADHIGGINTLFYTLSNAGTLVVAPERSPDAVAETISRWQVELLPTSPTFLNLLLMSGAVGRHDMSSLKLITYGTEPMPQSTLARIHEVFPNVKLLQTYGMTELGILRSQSQGPESLWVRVGGEGYQTRVVDGRLQVKATSAMLGYLNAPSPFTADGYFETGDRVETDGEWLRILGRDSEIINVGGNKVYPAEVESVLLQLDNVVDATVFGRPNAITGQAVACAVRLSAPEELAAFKARMRQHCATRMAGFKVPVSVKVTTEALHSARFKRMRRDAAPAAEQP